MCTFKKHLPRRTVLRGLGTALALPWLDGMVPALTALAQSGAAPARRFGFLRAQRHVDGVLVTADRRGNGRIAADAARAAGT